MYNSLVDLEQAPPIFWADTLSLRIHDPAENPSTQKAEITGHIYSQSFPPRERARQTLIIVNMTI